MIMSLSGFKNSGKDTVAKILVENYGFTRIAFADTLKDMASKMYNIPRSFFDDPDKKENPILSLPVESKDKFAEMLHSFMLGEFRDEFGNPPRSSSFSQTQSEPLYHTPRSLAILLGSINRSVRSDFWVAQALRQINPSYDYVITDMRYRSELDQIVQYAKNTDQKATSVRIDRFDVSPSKDPSEVDLINVKMNFTLDNRGSVEDLTNKVHKLMKTI